MFRSEPTNPNVWHKSHVFLPVRTIEGKLTMFDVWRKWDGLKWIYQDRPMTEEERADLTTY